MSDDNAHDDAPLDANQIAAGVLAEMQAEVERLQDERIRALAEEKDLKVYVFAEDVCASGGYMLACAGDEIIADETSIVGSIGVVAATFGFVEAMVLLESESNHAVGVGAVFMGDARAFAEAQQCVCVAKIEGVILAPFDGA